MNGIRMLIAGAAVTALLAMAVPHRGYAQTAETPASPATQDAAKECPKFKKSLSPVEVLKRSTVNVQKILKLPAETIKQRETRDEQLKKEINTFIDFDTLGIRALGSHWDGLTGEQQQKFLDVLRDLIETAYTSRIKQYRDFSIEYTKQEIDCDEAFVATVARAGKGKLMTDYRLHWQNGRWFVWDLIIENTSLVRQYKTMFNKIIKRDGFDTLMKRMTNKKEEILRSKQLKREGAGMPPMPH